jgi:hypothetical protein
MLSPLQEQVAAIISSLPEAEGFALAGGGALIIRGEIHRGTRDLDFFGLNAAAVDRLVPVVERRLVRAGYQVERTHTGPGFARLSVQGLGDRTEVDLAADARLFPAEHGPNGVLLLSSRELAVDKVLAVFGRAEARDFLDLMNLESSFDMTQLFELASEKDRGFSPAVFAEMTERFERLGRNEFATNEEGYRQITVAVVRWRTLAKRLAMERDSGRDFGMDR